MNIIRAAALLALLSAACTKASDATSPKPSAKPTEVAPAEPAPPEASKPASRRPRPIVPEHGKLTWGVYVYAGTDASKRDAAIKLLEATGLKRGSDFGDGEISCDVGAAEALKVPEQSMAVSAFFANEADAQAFAASLATPPTGIVMVKVGCAD